MSVYGLSRTVVLHLLQANSRLTPLRAHHKLLLVAPTFFQGIHYYFLIMIIGPQSGSTSAWSWFSIRGGHVSAFSYMERQTNNSGLVSKMDMERQAKSRKRPCLGTQDKQIKMHITQKLLVGFLPNLHQQTCRVLVHLFVYEVIVVQTQNCVPLQYPFPPWPTSF